MSLEEGILNTTNKTKEHDKTYQSIKCPNSVYTENSEFKFMGNESPLSELNSVLGTSQEILLKEPVSSNSSNRSQVLHLREVKTLFKYNK